MSQNLICISYINVEMGGEFTDDPIWLSVAGGLLVMDEPPEQGPRCINAVLVAGMLTSVAARWVSRQAEGSSVVKERTRTSHAILASR